MREKESRKDDRLKYIEQKRKLKNLKGKIHIKEMKFFRSKSIQNITSYNWVGIAWGQKSGGNSKRKYFN